MASDLVDEENALIENKGAVPAEPVLRQAKLDGFSDRYLSQVLGITEEEVRNTRLGYGIREAWEGIHVSGTENAAYYYSTYHDIKDTSPVSDKPKIMILGGGPNRIGQGIEFDYCCVHAALALKKLGFESIIVNCNPETVSTDYDTSDKLYFEPLTLEDVLAIHDKEKPVGVIAQFGGQTPLNLAGDLKKNGVNILGTSPETIDLAEDRDHFRAMMEKLGIPMPESGMAVNVEEALKIAKEAELDLVKIAPQAKPPVCKIVDYGKYRYEMARKEKEAKKKQKTMEIKEVRFSPNIDTNDLNTKINMARKFISHGDKVKVTLRFRGRELAHVEQTKGILDEFAEQLSDIAVVDKPAKFEGRSMIMFLTQKR